MLNFGDRTRTGAFNVVWPLATDRERQTDRQTDRDRERDTQKKDRDRETNRP